MSTLKQIVIRALGGALGGILTLNHRGDAGHRHPGRLAIRLIRSIGAVLNQDPRFRFVDGSRQSRRSRPRRLRRNHSQPDAPTRLRRTSRNRRGPGHARRPALVDKPGQNRVSLVAAEAEIGGRGFRQCSTCTLGVHVEHGTYDHLGAGFPDIV